MNTPLTLTSFQPTTGLRNPHMQTIMGAVLRSTDGVMFHRQRLDTPDGDFFDLDFPDLPDQAWAAFTETAPIVLLLHGLGGSARTGYACEMYRQLAQEGIRSVGLNYRSCSGEMNRTTKAYHAGATEDVVVAAKWLRHTYPQARLGVVGFSLGANVLLKFLAETGALVDTAVAVSPPFDLAASAVVLAKKSRRPYTRSLLTGLKKKVKQNEARLDAVLNLEQVMASQTLYEFDDRFTAPLHGFQGADDYYRQCSAAQFLPDICVPTLIIRALDDPFFSRRDVPHETISDNQWLQPQLTAHGGHVGFAEGPPWDVTWWAHEQATRFLKFHLN